MMAALLALLSRKMGMNPVLSPQCRMHVSPAGECRWHSLVQSALAHALFLAMLLCSPLLLSSTVHALIPAQLSYGGRIINVDQTMGFAKAKDTTEFLAAAVIQTHRRQH